MGEAALLSDAGSSEQDGAQSQRLGATRDRAVLRGALAIRNTAGIAIKAASARVIDAELGSWRGKTAEQLATTLVNTSTSTAPPVAARELGPIEVGEGETRVELVGASSRPMRAVLVYDPIGTKLDNPGASPLRDPELGMRPPASPRGSAMLGVFSGRVKNARLANRFERAAGTGLLR